MNKKKKRKREREREIERKNIHNQISTYKMRIKQNERLINK